MKELKFKTSINCESCLGKVEPFLNKNEEIKGWNVDLDSPDKILIVQTENLDSCDVKKIIKRVGFDIEEI